MNNTTFSTMLESFKNNDRINTRVEQLKSKLKNFAVLDRQGELIGEVKDLILDNNRQLNLVVSQLAQGQAQGTATGGLLNGGGAPATQLPFPTAPRSRLFLLMSKLIQKVDAASKAVLVNINKAEVEHLPEYVTTETPRNELTEIPIEAADESTTEDSPESNLSDLPQIELTHIQKKPDNSSDNPDVLSEELIRLLGERLLVERSKRKVGEVIVRKEIETRMVQVQVPIRHEKLILEQVSPERKKLAEIDLVQEKITRISVFENAIQETEIANLDEVSNLTDSNA